MAVKVEIISYIPDTEKELIISAFKKKYYADTESSYELEIYNSPRLGNAVVYTIIAKCNGRHIVDHISKIDSTENIYNEFNRYSRCIKSQNMDSGEVFSGSEKGGRGIILFEYALPRSAEEDLPIDANTYEEMINGDYKRDDKARVLKNIYGEKFIIPDRDRKRINCNLLSHYTGNEEKDSLGLNLPDYINRKGSDFTVWLSSLPTNSQFIDCKIFNIVDFINKFPPFLTDTEIVVKNVHGDLHPKNIYVSNLFNPKLIDFKWSHRGHALKDYVLMEASLFLFSFPRFQSSLLELTDIIKVIVNNFYLSGEFSFGEPLNTILFLIKNIREEAVKFCLWKSKEAEYFSSLLLVIVGLLQIRTANTILGIYYALQLAKSLEDKYGNDNVFFIPDPAIVKEIPFETDEEYNIKTAKNKKQTEDKNITGTFITDYKVTLIQGSQLEGIIKINNKVQINLGAVECGIFKVMARQSIDDWTYLLGESERNPLSVGWVSYREFRNSVSNWMSRIEAGDEVADSVIINAINRLNKKIMRALHIEKNVIENGTKTKLKPKNYRLKFYPKYLEIKDID